MNSFKPLRVGEAPLIKWSLITLAVFLGLLLLLLPLVSIFQQAFVGGWERYIGHLSQPDSLHAIALTLMVAALTVPINLVFGIMLAWSVTRFEYPGRKLLITLIDIPFAVSPVVAGLLYLLLYGNSGWLGILLVTIFVTCPFVARELIPLMQQQGASEEEAAVILGASWWQLFRRVTLPNIKWALIYGVILTNARAVGEFGAVAVVSGNIRGETNTLPLHVQLLYEDYQAEAAFASASLLALIALVTLMLKAVVEWRQQRSLSANDNKEQSQL